MFYLIIFIKKILYKITFFRIRLKNNVVIGENIVFKKMPYIQLDEKAKLIIGNNCVINSDNFDYHINMFQRCKFIADKPSSIILIGDNTRFHGSCIHAYKKISIGENCLIAANCQIIDGNGHDLSFENVSNRINSKGDSKEVIIEDNVWLGTGVVVLPGVTIGQGSIISAYSIVHKNIPPMVIAGGNPIKIIKEFGN